MITELEKLIEYWESFKPVGHPNAVIWDSFINDAKKALEKEKNKWIKIESEKDLPKKKGKYWVVLFDKTHQILYEGDRVFEKGNSSEITEKDWWLKFITHYQPIQKPEPPIF